VNETSEPIVIRPAITSLPPTTSTATPTMPASAEVSAPTPEIVRIVAITLRNRSCALCANTRVSRRSARYAFTTRMPEKFSLSRPVISAFSSARFLKIGRTVLNAKKRIVMKTTTTTAMIAASFALK